MNRPSSDPDVKSSIACLAIVVGARRVEPRENAHVLAADGEASPAEEVPALAPDENELDLLARVVDDERGRSLDDVRVEAAGQALVSRDDDELNARARLPHIALGEQRMRRRIDARREPLQYAQDLLPERPRAHDPLVGAAHPGRGHHLHGLGNLLRRLDRADTAPDIN